MDEIGKASRTARAGAEWFSSAFSSTFPAVMIMSLGKTSR